MEQWIAWLAALVSFSAFLVLWFREVRRMLRSLKSIVDSALEQAAACRSSAAADERAAGLAQRLIIDDRCEQARGGAAADGAELFVVAEQSHNSLSLLFLCR